MMYNGKSPKYSKTHWNIKDLTKCIKQASSSSIKSKKNKDLFVPDFGYPHFRLSNTWI